MLKKELMTFISSFFIRLVYIIYRSAEKILFLGGMME